MKQVLHIFKKDIRHCWRECAAGLVLLLLFAWGDVRSWADSNQLRMVGRFLPFQLEPLLIFSWWFLIARAIQDEPLVGDRQFWVTRPYQWKQLLVAKILFVFTFINVPLFLIHVSLLRLAGFHVLPELYGLLYLQFLTSLAFLIPIVALAVVTPTVAQMVLAVVAVLILMGMLTGLGSAVPNANFGSGSEFFQISIVIVVALAVILWQYSRRKVVFARWLIAAAAVAVTLVMVATPYRTIIEREYPALAAGGQPPVQLSLHPVETPVVRDDAYVRDDVEIMIPLNVSGVASGSIVALNGLEATIDSAGTQWDSHWHSYSQVLYSGQTRAQLRFNVPADLYERIKTLLVHTRLTLAFTGFREGDARPFVIPSTHFTLPELGICSLAFNNGNSIRCRSALRQPSLLEVTTEASATTCHGQSGLPLPPPGTVARYSYLSGSGPATLELSPIQSFDLGLAIDAYLADAYRLNRGICPGTPLTLISVKPVEHGRFDLDLGNIRLLDYRWGNNGLFGYAR
jgi:hypothetical protein